MEFTKKEYLRDNEYNEKKVGIKIHLAVYILVSIILTAVNLIFVPEFYWFLFPVVGMGIGVILHYYLAFIAKI